MNDVFTAWGGVAREGIVPAAAARAESLELDDDLFGDGREPAGGRARAREAGRRDANVKHRADGTAGSSSRPPARFRRCVSALSA